MDKSNKELALEASQATKYIKIANDLIDNLEKLDGKENSPRRWVWELLQNAKDASNGKGVNVEILIDSTYVEFKHDGYPFEMKHLVSIIEGVSSKPRDKEEGEDEVKTTGKYGTGFLTTHLLSEKICLKSVYKGAEDRFQDFEILLDRSDLTQKGMIEKVKEAFKVPLEDLDNETLCPYKNSNYVPREDCDTVFHYPLNEKSLSVAKTGIEDLHNCIAYTLVFTPEIQSVRVKNNLDKTEIFYTTGNITDDHNISLVEIHRELNNNSSSILIALAKSNKVQIGITLQKNSSGQYVILKREPKNPVLYLDFPLVGSENFNFPVIIKSHLFNPDEPRSRVPLNQEKKAVLNKELFESSVDLYAELLDFATKNCLNAHLLAFSKMPNGVDEDWFKKSIQIKIREFILPSDIVETTTPKIPLEKALIPFVEKNNLLSFWKLASALHPDGLPKEEEN